MDIGLLTETHIRLSFEAIVSACLPMNDDSPLLSIWSRFHIIDAIFSSRVVRSAPLNDRTLTSLTVIRRLYLATADLIVGQGNSSLVSPKTASAPPATILCLVASCLGVLASQLASSRDWDARPTMMKPSCHGSIPIERPCSIVIVVPGMKVMFVGSLVGTGGGTVADGGGGLLGGGGGGEKPSEDDPPGCP